MKFKPTLLLASMVAAGALVTAPAFAHGHASAKAANASVAKMEAIMNRNQQGVKGSADWAHKIHVSGEINVDASYSSNNYTSGTVGSEPFNQIIANHSASDFAVNNANVYVDADVSDWTSAHISLSERQDRSDTTAVPRVFNQGSGLGFEEVYVSMHNFSQSPFYFNFGQQYLDFGHNAEHHPIFASLTQLMSETNAVAATFGGVSNTGLYGSVSVFRGQRDIDDNDTNNPKTKVNDYSLNLGYTGEQDGLTYDLGLGFIRDIASANYVNQRIFDGKTNRGSEDVKHQVGAWDLHAALASGPFYGDLEYVAANRKFGDRGSSNGFDLAYKSKGAKPSALDVMVGYKFKTGAYDSSLELTYGHTTQASGDATNNANGLYLPQDRYEAVYNVAAYKHTNIGFGLLRDKDYSVAKGGSGKSTTAATIRVGVEFA